MILNNAEKGANLIPFEVLEVATNVSEIPKGIEIINAPSVWEKSEKGKNIVIAVLDTGCQVDHPELKDCIIGGRNFTMDYNSDPNNFSDNIGHGTHVAGTIAAMENNQGVVGVAPLAKLLIVKVLGADGFGSFEWIANGIDYAVNWRGSNGEKVRVISMSLGGNLDDSRLHQAVKNAVENDVLVVCAAGNNGDCSESTDELSYPGVYQEVVEVGAVDLHKKIACFSNSNKNVDLVAPGEGIWSTYIGGGYAKLSGTSMATPHVSGGSALIIRQCEKEFGRKFSETEIYAQLIKRTTDIGYDRTLEGSGLLDFTKG
ncbi:S8 family peptidase [Bacillus thuringiensis]|uniref:S8 family peptidase n=1 Tax=Bacillus thuringiensis TaxID=1428 RepID=UPI000BF3EB30|nr:S8 family peptidase [Bacillus thuringiensis]PEY84420.1 serine protease [Bacillus thuringiensis]PFE60490.1 serine protease [Bacillus thuringiensis]PFI31142.1 serine protease [Bacillus thuringiensis]HDX9619572.1 S8 family peptidase [Bacillus thuringiensis]